MRSKRMYVVLLLLLVIVPFVYAQGVGLKGTTSVNFAPNDTVTGTFKNLLAKKVAGKMILATTSDTAVSLFVTLTDGPTPGTAAKTGYTSYVLSGPTDCIMDAANASGVSGRPVVISTLVDGRCHAMTTNAPSYLPASGWIVGTMVDDTTTVGGLAKIDAQPAPTGAVGGTGITSLTLAEPPEFTVTGSPLTTAGTLTVGKANAAANCVMAGPASGGAAPWACRALVAADMPGGGAGPTGAAGGDLGGTYPNPTVLQSSTTFAFTGDITPSTLVSSVNDYTPTNFATNTVVYIDGGTGARTISGFAAAPDGTIKLIVNAGATDALLLPNHTSPSAAASAAVNRLLLGGDTRLFPGEAQALIYRTAGAVNRWLPFGRVVYDAERIRSFTFSIGSPSASAAPIAADDAVPDGFTNDYGRDLELLTVACKANNTGLVITPILQGGTATSILTGALTCPNGSWGAGTVQATPPVVRSFSGTGVTCSTPPCAIDTTWTTSGLATYATIKITGRLK